MHRICLLPRPSIAPRLLSGIESFRIVRYGQHPGLPDGVKRWSGKVFGVEISMLGHAVGRVSWQGKDRVGMKARREEITRTGMRRRFGARTARFADREVPRAHSVRTGVC